MIKNIKELLFNHTMNKKVQFNDDLFDRDYNLIIEELKMIILSCQRYAGFKIKVRGFSVIDNYEQIKNIQAKYYPSIKRANSKYMKDNPYECINLNDSDVVILAVSYYLEGSDGESQIFNTMIYVPIFIDKYYMNIMGVKYSPLLQIVDGATYNLVKTDKRVNNTVIGKTVFGAIKMYNNPGFNTITTIDGEILDCTIYSCNIYNRINQVCLYILAKYGLYGSIEFLELKHIHFGNDIIDLQNKEDYYHFTCGAGIYISVPKVLYDADKVTQSLIGTIMSSVGVKDNLYTVSKAEYWVFKISETFKFNNVSKGYTTLQSIENLFDRSTQKYIHLPDEDKLDIYHFLRWMMREYDILINKSNYSLRGKRIRLAEYITSIYANKLANNIGRLLNGNNNIKLKDLIQIVNIEPGYLIKYISQCGIVDDLDLPNDDDGKIGIKYSFKGPAGVSNQKPVDNTRRFKKNGKKEPSQQGGHLPIEFRHIDYSHLGVLDLYSSPKSDPGLGGLLVPSAKLYDDNYLYQYEEPNKWREKYSKLLEYLEFEKNLSELINFKEKIYNGSTKTEKGEGNEIYLKSNLPYKKFPEFKPSDIYIDLFGEKIKIDETCNNVDDFYI